MLDGVVDDVRVAIELATGVGEPQTTALAATEAALKGHLEVCEKGSRCSSGR